jgi:hypothetical protein
MVQINNIPELISAVFSDKVIFYIKDGDRIYIDFSILNDKLIKDRSFLMELEYGCHGNIADFIKLNNFIEFMKGSNTWVVSEREFVFPNLRDLYYEETNANTSI